MPRLEEGLGPYVGRNLLDFPASLRVLTTTTTAICAVASLSIALCSVPLEASAAEKRQLQSLLEPSAGAAVGASTRTPGGTLTAPSVLSCAAGTSCVSTSSFLSPSQYLAPWSFDPRTPDTAMQ